MIIERDKIYLDGYGRKIRIICTDRKSKYCVVGLNSISDTCDSETLLYTKGGLESRNCINPYDEKLHLVKEYQEPVYNWTIWRKCRYDTGLYSDTFTSEANARSVEDIVSIARIDVETGEVLQLNL